MSLPSDPKMLWPPTEPAADFPVWSSWYSGEPSLLATDATPARTNVMSRFRSFWGRQSRPVDGIQASGKHPLHLPMAADVCQTSADLLFGSPVDFKLADPKGKAQKRLEEIVELAGIHNTLLEAAETCAAMGGVYLRATWADEVDFPFLTTMQADQAVPEFAWGRLTAVTFWRELPSDVKGKTFRHLERHERGAILHGLYLGDGLHLGNQVSLEARPETKELQGEVKLPNGLECDVWYVPNARPNRKRRSSPVGRPDIAGAESLLDALDEAYSSLIRDIRLGKGRLLVPSGSLRSPSKIGGRGEGKTFDVEAEVFTELDGIDPASGEGITVAQFEIRTQQHLEAAADLVERIASNAGYSPQTFGLHIEGRAESGTALRLREGKTYRTVNRKRRYWNPALQAAMAALLVIDPKTRGKLVALTPTTTWPEETATPAEQASTLSILRTAEAASVQTRVAMLHPDWDEDKITEESERIRAESGVFVQPPDAGTGGAETP